MDFMKRMLSDNGEPSSKRVLAVLTVTVVLLAFSVIVLRNTDAPASIVSLFQGLLVFAGVCLGLNVTKDIFAGKKDGTP